MENQFIFFSLLILKNYTHIVQDKSTFQTSIQASYYPLRFRIDYRRWRAIRDTFLQRDLEKPRVPVKMSRFSSRLPPMKLLLRFISDLPFFSSPRCDGQKNRAAPVSGGSRLPMHDLSFDSYLERPISLPRLYANWADLSHDPQWKDGRIKKPLLNTD